MRGEENSHESYLSTTLILKSSSDCLPKLMNNNKKTEKHTEKTLLIGVPHTNRAQLKKDPMAGSLFITYCLHV